MYIYIYINHYKLMLFNLLISISLNFVFLSTLLHIVMNLNFCQIMYFQIKHYSIDLGNLVAYQFSLRYIITYNNIKGKGITFIRTCPFQSHFIRRFWRDLKPYHCIKSKKMRFRLRPCKYICKTVYINYICNGKSLKFNILFFYDQ